MKKLSPPALLLTMSLVGCLLLSGCYSSKEPLVRIDTRETVGSTSDRSDYRSNDTASADMTDDERLDRCNRRISLLEENLLDAKRTIAKLERKLDDCEDERERLEDRLDD